VLDANLWIRRALASIPLFRHQLFPSCGYMPAVMFMRFWGAGGERSQMETGIGGLNAL
jgi:hypothetical protein